MSVKSILFRPGLVLTTALCLAPLLAEEDLPRIKANIARHAWAKSIYEKLIGQANEILTADVTVPDRKGQWWHYCVCVKCGTRLRTISPTVHECQNAKCKASYSGEPYDSVPISCWRNAAMGCAALAAGDAELAWDPGSISYALPLHGQWHRRSLLLGRGGRGDHCARPGTGSSACREFHQQNDSIRRTIATRRGVSGPAREAGMAYDPRL